MANVENMNFAFIFLKVTCVLLYMSHVHSQENIVFQPSFLSVSGPTITAFLVGNASDVTLNLRTVSPSISTGSIGPVSCVSEPTRWVLTTEQIGKTVVQLDLRLNQTLNMCTGNDTDCCREILCVFETLQVTACKGIQPQTSLLIQVNIHARLLPAQTGYGNITVIPNQAYQPLGPCPCDLTLGVCDIRCCCDEDCSTADLELFAFHCLPGPFGGQVSPDPDYHCSVQSSQNSPDWFPFLCVVSSPKNNPNLGLFYHGDTITPKNDPSFQSTALLTPLPVDLYVQGTPLKILNSQFFTIPQKFFGQCVNNAPVAFLKNFQIECVTLLNSCPTEYPLKTLPADLSIQLMSGHGGIVTVDVVDEIATDLTPFIFHNNTVSDTAQRLVCEKVTLALDYKFFWQANSITAISLTRTIGTLISNVGVTLTSRYSAVFHNGNLSSDSNSGNLGYLVGKPLIGGFTANYSDPMQRMSINTWKPVHNGLCSSAEKKAVLFGENTTSGCLLPVGQELLTRCDFLREMVFNLQAGLITSTFVAKIGNPDFLTTADWINIFFGPANSSQTLKNLTSACQGIPSHLQILVWNVFTNLVDAAPQKEIHRLQISYNFSTWEHQCGGGNLCNETQFFPITSSVTFIDIPVKTEPSKTRYQINFTEYDCNRNDVCWPELAFPITRYYTGEAYSQSLAKGMILVFFFLIASILGTPWKQIRQIWHSCGF